MKLSRFSDSDALRYRAKLVSDLRPIKDKAISALNVKPGKSFIDIGCGRGADTIQIGEMVGPAGRVVGVGLKDSALKSADQLAMKMGMRAWIQFMNADACNLPLADSQFDGCICERVLQHIPEPYRAVTEMGRLLKRGGRISLMDTDWSTLTIDCDDMQMIINNEMASREGATSGRRLFAFAKSAGFIDIEVTTFTTYFTAFAYADYICNISGIIGNAVARGVIQAAAAEKLAEDLISRDQKQHFFAMVTGVLVCGARG